MKKNYSRILGAILSASMLPVPAAQVLATETSAPAAQAEVNEYEIYPVPHSVEYVSENGSNARFNVSDSVNVVYEDGIDSYTKNYLNEILEENHLTGSVSDAVVEGKTNILLGIYNSNEYVSSWLDSADLNETLFSKTDAYYLKAQEENGTSVIAVVGKDTDAAFYGLSTLEYMFSSLEGNVLLEAQIEDYASKELRGFIEGFYGGFDYTGRESQIRFLRKVKGNRYVFASKTDPYHYTWNNQYPADELAQIANLVEIAKENKVRYVWSFHSGKAQFLNGVTADPSKSDTAAYQEYQQRLEVLKAKFTQLYDIGVRDFHILNDDYNSGTYTDLAYFLNDMNAWLKERGCGPLVFCPDNYCRSWSNRIEGEMAAYKEKLDKDILLYWTGAQVNCPIVQSDVDYVYSRTGNDVVTWVNFPCSEHDKAGIYIGAATHYLSNANNMQHTRGLMSNPVNYPEANKVAYFQLMSWLWNDENYSSYMNELWSDSFKYIEPEVADSYRTIAHNVNNCPDSGRYAGTGFPESEYIKDAIESVQAKILGGVSIAKDEEVLALRAEFENIVSAVKDFRKNCTNEALLSDLNPWLGSLEAIASAAGSDIDAAIALENDDLSAAWTAFSKASAQLPLWDSYSPREYPEKRAKAGSKRIKPFASTLTSYLGSKIQNQINPDFEEAPSVISSFASGTNIDRMIDGDLATYAEWKTDQKIGDYIGVNLGKRTTIHDVTITQAQSDGHHDRIYGGALEYSLDGSTWTPLAENLTDEKIEVDGLNVEARYLRLRVTSLTNPSNPDKTNYWLYVREFSWNKNGDSSSQIYTNLKNLSGPTVSKTDTGWLLSNLNGVALGKDEYIGIRLEEPKFFAGVTSNVSGAAVEYSMDGINWSSEAISARTPAVYARIRNTGNTALTLGASSVLTVTEGTGAEASVSNENIPSLRDGSWENLIDGDLNTYVWTGVNQAPGQSITVDFGRALPGRSLSLFMEDGRPRLYHGTVSVSADGTNWKEAMVVDAGGNDIALIDGNKRKARCELDGSMIRYVKIDVTDTAKEESSEGQAFLKLYELQLNDAAIPEDKPSLFEGTSLSSSYEKAADNDLSTFFEPEENETSGSIEYTVTKNNDAQKLVIVGDADSISHAVVEVLTDQSDAYQKVGNLDEVISRFDLPKDENVCKVRITWTADNPKPRLYEIFMSRDAAQIIEPVNLALRQPVTSSGTEVDDGRWTADKAVDGNKDDDASRWSSPRMKTGTAADQTQTPQWIQVDLGSDCEIHSIVTAFHLRVYATDYDILISDDGENWTPLAQGRGFEAGSSLSSPVDTLELSEPVHARYVKLMINEINHLAAGVSVSIRELEVYGVRSQAQTDIDTSLLELSVDKADTLSLDAYQLNADAKAEFEQLASTSRELIKDASSQDEVDAQAKKMNEALLALRKAPSKAALPA